MALGKLFNSPAVPSSTEEWETRVLGSWVGSGERVLGFAVCPQVLGVLCIQHLPSGSPRALSLPTCHSTPSVCGSMAPTIHRGKLRHGPVNDHTQGPIDCRKKVQSLIPELSLQRTRLSLEGKELTWSTISGQSIGFF